MSSVIDDYNGVKILRRSEALKVLKRRLVYLLGRCHNREYSTNSFGHLRAEINSLRWVIKLAEEDIKKGGKNPTVESL